MSERNDLEVQITSNGVSTGTTVRVNGKEITNCVGVSWRIDVNGVAIATLELEGAELHVVPDG